MFGAFVLCIFICIPTINFGFSLVGSAISNHVYQSEDSSRSEMYFDSQNETFSTTDMNESNYTVESQDNNVGEEIELFMPLVLNPNATNEQFYLKPNRDFFEWLQGIFNLNGSIDNPLSQAMTSGSHTHTTPSFCPSCTCGLTNVMQRIVGGIVTKINQYPWMVALKYNNRFFCGGTLINSRYVLTAGHCVGGLAKERLVAVFLEHDRSDAYETKTFNKKVINIYRHKSYNSGGNYNNDIALLKLEDEVKFVDNMRPACLPTMGKSFSGMIGKATGWGATQEYGQVSSKLREVDVPILSNEKCMKTSYGNKITANMLCAGFVTEGGKDACQGDSGGPLHVLNGTQNMVVGIVSWGEGCAEKNNPGVYTRVNRYLTWIRTNTKDACYC